MGQTLCFTGHRPNKLGGYSGERAKTIQDGIFGKLVHVVQRAIDVGFDTFISGGALGIDQIGAEAVLHRKRNPAFSHIKLIIARPFPSQACKWPRFSQENFENLCEKADKIVDVSEDPYSPEKMQIRNEWMVDNSDAVIAVWNKSGGGTGNCVDYATKQFKPILVIDPYTLVEKWRMHSKNTDM